MKEKNERECKINEKKDVLDQRPERASPPSISLRESTARQRTGDGKFGTMT
jgi:hypothetical protein